MRLPPETSTGDFAPAPAGTHVAICTQVIDLGTVTESFQGGPPKPKRKVRIAWELSGESMSDGRPFLVGKTYTFSSDPKATLRHNLESWRGKPFEPTDFGPEGFDVRRLLGVPCLLNVVHAEREGKKWAAIAAIMPLAKGMAKPTMVGEALFFSMDEAAFDEATYAKLGEYWRTRIAETPEYKHWHVTGGKPASDLSPPPPGDDDISF